MRIVCISDTHELHRNVRVPKGDLLIHAGDFTWFSKRPSMISDFNSWLGELSHPYKVAIPGNHEFAFEADLTLCSEISNATLLIDEGVEVAGIKIWGSPTTPLYGGAFGRSSPADRAQLYSSIPQLTDILITHGPPLGILDQESPTSPHAGCQELLEAVEHLRPRLHVFGHIHGAWGILQTQYTTFINAALFGRDGQLDKAPIVLDFDPVNGAVHVVT